MATKGDTETQTVVRKLSIFLVLFYVVYYVVSAILVAAFKLDWHDLGTFPFRNAAATFAPGHDGPALAGWLAMVITFTISLGLAYWVVAATRRSWDYLTTTAILHWGITSAVSVGVPTNWIWWVTLAVSALVTSVAAELLIYRFKDLAEIPLHH